MNQKIAIILLSIALVACAATPTITVTTPAGSEYTVKNPPNKGSVSLEETENDKGKTSILKVEDKGSPNPLPAMYRSAADLFGRIFSRTDVTLPVD